MKLWTNLFKRKLVKVKVLDFCISILSNFSGKSWYSFVWKYNFNVSACINDQDFFHVLWVSLCWPIIHVISIRLLNTFLKHISNNHLFITTKNQKHFNLHNKKSPFHQIKWKVNKTISFFYFDVAPKSEWDGWNH